MSMDDELKKIFGSMNAVQLLETDSKGFLTGPSKETFLNALIEESKLQEACTCPPREHEDWGDIADDCPIHTRMAMPVGKEDWKPPSPVTENYPVWLNEDLAKRWRRLTVLIEDATGVGIDDRHDGEFFKLQNKHEDCRDCTCGAEHRSRPIEHTVLCELEMPSVIFKPADIRIQWSRGPYRDACANRKITPDEWEAMRQACETMIAAKKPPRLS